MTKENKSRDILKLESISAKYVSNFASRKTTKNEIILGKSLHCLIYFVWFFFLFCFFVELRMNGIVSMHILWVFVDQQARKRTQSKDNMLQEKKLNCSMKNMRVAGWVRVCILSYSYELNKKILCVLYCQLMRRKYFQLPLFI
mgnify:CR=1 FL=1